MSISTTNTDDDHIRRVLGWSERHRRAPIDEMVDALTSMAKGAAIRTEGYGVMTAYLRGFMVVLHSTDLLRRGTATFKIEVSRWDEAEDDYEHVLSAELNRGLCTRLSLGADDPWVPGLRHALSSSHC